MAAIEDYALLSDLRTGPLISRRGSVDWLCFPRFDSPSVFGALLGNEQHGRWLLAPSEAAAVVIERRYVGSTFVLQTTWQAGSGQVQVTDFLPLDGGHSRLIRRVTGLSGTVEMRQELTIRPQYATVKPWISRILDDTPGQGGEVLLAMSGPDALSLRSKYLPQAEGHRHAGEFTVSQGQDADFELCWFPSHEDLPPATNINHALALAGNYWTTWAENCRDTGKYARAVKRSLLVLRALTHFETGGIVAAPTTSLPEEFGGARNWDYRYCWLRDASLTLEVMLTHGYEVEALKWRNWLLRALAGDPEDLQIMYGVGGERELTEKELNHLPGYEQARPVRVGNAAVNQYQADVVGEVMVALEKLRLAGGKEDHFSWALQSSLLRSVENHLQDKDYGLWEMRGDAQYFTHSRVMMWAAFNCGIKAVRDHGLPGPLQHWEEIRDRLASEILVMGFNEQLNSFTQTYGGQQTDAALLILPQVEFLAYEDSRMLGTVAQLEKDLLTPEGLLLRYRTESGVDGLEPGEHPFLPCSFWLVEQYARSGRQGDATKLMDLLVGLSNELGLLSEEYSMTDRRMAGNFPQAFSHLALVRAADALRAGEAMNLLG